MGYPFIGEVRIFAGDFVPRRFIVCDGQEIPIAQNTVLFGLLGTTYGGDGRTTLRIPDLRGRAPMHPGHAPGLSQRLLGRRGGTERVALIDSEIPPHNHLMTAYDGPGDQENPSNNYLARGFYAGGLIPVRPIDLEQMSPDMLGETGEGQAHDNMQPFLTLNFIMGIHGRFPNRPG